MGILYCVPECNVEFNAVHVSGVALKPAGLRIICEAVNIAKDLPYNVGVTSGTDGQHSGPPDPHHRGEAIDFMTRNMPTMGDKYAFASAMIFRLVDGTSDTPFRVNGKDDSAGWACARWFAFVEDPGLPNEHIHVQLRQGCVYP